MRIALYVVLAMIMVGMAHLVVVIIHHGSPWLGIATFVALMTVLTALWVRPVAVSLLRFSAAVVFAAACALVLALTLFRTILTR
jgi:hypothetical protein